MDLEVPMGLGGLKGLSALGDRRDLMDLGGPSMFGEGGVACP